MKNFNTVHDDNMSGRWQKRDKLKYVLYTSEISLVRKHTPLESIQNLLHMLVHFQTGKKPSF